MRLERRAPNYEGKMFERILSVFTMRCRHGHVTQPFASAPSTDYSRNADWQPMSKSAAMSHYVVCLDCGRKFGYDWAQMRVIWH